MLLPSPCCRIARQFLALTPPTSCTWQVITLDHKRYEAALDQIADSHRKSQQASVRPREAQPPCFVVLPACMHVRQSRACQHLTLDPLHAPPCRCGTR